LAGEGISQKSKGKYQKLKVGKRKSADLLTFAF
jgi:hypothetical protein